MIKRFFHYIKNTYKIISEAVKNSSTYEAIEDYYKMDIQTINKDNHDFWKRVERWIKHKFGNQSIRLLIVIILFPFIISTIQLFTSTEPIFSDFQLFIPYLVVLLPLFLQMFLVTSPYKINEPCSWKIAPIFFIFCICAILWLCKLVCFVKEIFVLSFVLALFQHATLRDIIYWILGIAEHLLSNIHEEKNQYTIFVSTAIVLSISAYMLKHVFIFVANNYADKYKDFSFKLSSSNTVIISGFIFLLIGWLYSFAILKVYDIDTKIARNIANEQIVKMTKEVSKEMEKDDAFQDQIIIKKAVKLIEEVSQKENKDSEKSIYKCNVNCLDFVLFLYTFIYIWLLLFSSSIKRENFNSDNNT